MHRRTIFKTGLALAGGSVLSSVISAQNNIYSSSTAPIAGRRKLGTR